MTQRTCSVDGCERPVRARGWCSMHYHRWQRRGAVEPRSWAGSLNPSWKGEAAGSNAIHRRLDRKHGPASDFPCVDGCGRMADHWSYDHTDPDERPSDRGPYSTDITRYVPRCVKCHKAFDLSHLGLTGKRLDPAPGPPPRPLKTHCVNGHEFTEDNIYRPPDHPRTRRCMACQRDRDAKRKRNPASYR